MPNWITNVIKFNSKEDLDKVRQLMETKERVFDLNKLIPQPEYLTYTDFPNELDLIFPSMLLYMMNKTKDKDLDIYKYMEKKIKSIYDNIFDITYKTNDLLRYLNIMSTKLRMFNTYEEKEQFILNEFKKVCENKKYDKLTFVAPYTYTNGRLYDIEITKEDKIKEFAKPAGKEVCLEMGKYYFDLYTKYGVFDWYEWRNKYWGTKWNTSENEIRENLIIFNTPWNTPMPVFNKIKKLLPDIEFTVYSMDEGFVGSLYVIKVDKNRIYFTDTRDCPIKVSEKIYTYATKLAYGEDYDWRKEELDEEE